MPNVTSYLDWSDKGRSGFGRYLAGIIIAAVIFFVLSGFGMIPVVLLVPDYQQSPVYRTVAVLAAFVVSFLTLPLLVRLIHGRPYWSIAMPAPRFESWHFWTGFWVATVVGVVMTLLASLSGIMPLERNPAFVPSALLPLMVIGFAGIFVQAGSEEMLFRGYLTQMIRRFTTNPFIFIGVPVLLFALPHIGNIAAVSVGLS